jgi:chemotaxis protein MotB
VSSFPLHQRPGRAVTSARDPLRAGRDRWLISYADLVTLLFACFTTAYAATQTSVPSAAEAAPVAPPPIADPREPDAPKKPTLRDIVAPLVVAAVGTTPIELVEDQRGLVISLPESATFPTGSAALTEPAKAFLVALATALRVTSASLRIEGHTDDVPLTGGRYGTNWELSTARASAVVLFLIDAASFAPDRLSAAGYGEFHPRVANDTPERRALNRRVDVVVIDPLSGEQP